ncbi:hypothetical protein ACF0H5_007566 [Mactra antiquata]
MVDNDITQDSEKGQFDSLNKKKKVGNYLLGKLLGEGAFSKVRNGLHIIAREKVAVKIVPKKAALLREYVKKSVRREAMLLQKLEHPNIVKLYEIMETENSYYLVLEFAEGGEFIKYLSEKKRLSEMETQKYIRQIASAVDHMHISNISHRDLKLENLLLDKDNNIKIIDFGASNVFYGDYSLSTQCGSPVYAAPEMYCNRKYGPAVDVWSMGICMYAMLTGKLPFLPEPPNNFNMLHSLIMRGAQLPDTLSDDCANMITRMLAVDPSIRITVEEILTHSWLQQNQQMPVINRQPPLGKLYPHVPKTAIVTYMTTVFNFLEDDVLYSVIERKMNAVAATYHLLLKKLLAGVQLSMNREYHASPKSAALKVQDPKRVIESGKHPPLRTEFPAIQPEQSFLTESVPSASKSGKQMKSYIQLLKDSKVKSAQSLGLRSGYSFSSKQRDFTIRRHKTRPDIVKHVRTREDVGFLPDFILTYTQDEGAFNNSNSTTGKFEWEQTFVVSKREQNKLKSSASFKQKTQTHAQHRQNEQIKNAETEPRNESVDITLQAPPTSPATPFPPQIVTTSIFKSPREQPDVDKKYADIPKLNFDGGYGTSPIDAINLPESQTGGIPKQKIQLTRGVSLLDKTYKPGALSSNQLGRPPTKPKTLTAQEARSYFKEIEQAKVVGQGRKLVERERTPSGKIEDVHSLWSRKARTAGSHRQLTGFTHSASTYGRPSTHEINFRAVDPNGILQFPDIVRQPFYDERPTSPRETFVDGVTDIIKVQITSSAKY